MVKQIRKSRNYRKFKVVFQTRVKLYDNLNPNYKLRKKKWFFLRFNNKFKYFPRIRKINKLKFFFKNVLNIRRIFKMQNCVLTSSSLYKLYLKSSKGNPRYLFFLNLLESRIDVCLFRTGFFESSLSLRQFILHGNVYLNGCLITKPGILLKPDDLVQINFNHLNFNSVNRSTNLSVCNDFPHLEIDLETFSFIYLGYFNKRELFEMTSQQDVSFLNYIFKL